CREVERLLVDVEYIWALACDQLAERRIIVDMVPPVEADRQHLQRIAVGEAPLQCLCADSRLAPQWRNRDDQLDAGQRGELLGLLLVGADDQRLREHQNTHTIEN